MSNKSRVRVGSDVEGNVMGPLDGFKILELAGIGPAPFCEMRLAGMGADVIRIDRTQPAELGVPISIRYDVPNRNKRSIA